MGRESGARALHRLTALAINRLSKEGMHADGGNLYLHVSSSGSKSWLFRYMIDGKRRDMGLGSLRDVPADKAREEATRLRLVVRSGRDPLDSRDEDRRQALLRLETAQDATKTWAWCCRTYVATVKAPELSNTKHAAQWLSTLEAYTFPKLGEMAIGAITLNDVQLVLSEIWLTKTETASRVRQRMESVFSWAKVKGYRQGDNPAVWKGGLDHLLAKPSKVQEERHHPSLPYLRTQEFWCALKAKAGIAAKALQFLMLTVNRTNPVLMLEWSELDLEKALWVSPPEKMKTKFPHRIPLSKQAIELLLSMRNGAQGKYVFQINGEPLSNSSMNMVINKGLVNHKPPFIDPNEDDRTVVPHGFRSTFKVWSVECTDYPDALSELALAHSEGNKTKEAYLRTDQLVKRRPLMQDWADFVTK
jgi:integrase